MAKFIGRWKLESTENFDEYMSAVGVGFMLRKVASTLKPDLVFSQDGDTWTMRTESTFKTTEISFKMGEAFDEETADGRKVKSTLSLDGDCISHEQKGEKDSTLTRTIEDENTLVLVCKAKDAKDELVESKRVYKKVAT